MSVQLELYPQNYEGISNLVTTTTTTGPNMVSDGETFTTMNSSSTQTDGWGYSPNNEINGSQARMISENEMVYQNQLAPLVSNVWYRSRTLNTSWCSGASTEPPFPTEVAGNLIFGNTPCTAAMQGSLVAQRLSGLTVGQVYTLTVTVPTFTRAGSGSPYLTACQFSDSGGTFHFVSSTFPLADPYWGLYYLPGHPLWNPECTFEFTAQSPTETISVLAVFQNGDNVTISSIKVSSTTTTTTTSVVLPPDQHGTVICDLYEDEDIPLTLSIDDFKNVAEKVQSYSKAFSLPATKRNSKIFDNIFNFLTQFFVIYR